MGSRRGVEGLFEEGVERYLRVRGVDARGRGRRHCVVCERVGRKRRRVGVRRDILTG